MKFSKNYTQEITAQITYTNIAENQLLNKKSDSVLNLVLTGNGFKLMNYMLFTPNISIDMERTNVLNSKNNYFLTRQNSELLRKQLDYDGEIKAMSKDTLHVLFDRNQKKKIPIILDASITYAPGFASARGLVTVPDSVVIRGPSHLVDTIRTVTSRKIVLENINRDQEVTVSFELDKFSTNLKVIPDKVKGIIEVRKFTEGKITVPIQLSNVPAGTRIKIFPKNVTIIYKVSLEHYDEINASGFKVVANYEKKTPNNAFIPIQITKQPEKIQNIRLQEKQVQFVIVK